MQYIISDEKLEELQKYYAGNNMDNWIKTLKPVEQITSGLVDDLCHDFGIWATKQWTPKAKFIVYIQKAGE